MVIVNLMLISKPYSYVCSIPDRDASLIEQTIQQHVEANKVGYRSSTSSHPSSSPASERRLNLSDTSLASQHSRRQATAPSPQNQRRSGRQQQQTPQEELGFQVPPSSHFRSSHEELSFLRDSLKDIYEAVLLEDLIAAVEKSVDERLWRHVFYTPIEELRAELRKLDKNVTSRQEVMDELSKLLDKGTGFYHELIMALRCDHDIDLSTVALDVLQSESGTTKSKPAAAFDTKTIQNRRNGRSRQQSRSKDEPLGPAYSTEALANCIQKCFIYLGDLARYRTNIRLETQAMLATAQSPPNDSKSPQAKPSASDWQAARRFYTRAIQTFPDSGKPYGQLAILASYANDDLDALYWYTLSLGAKCPSVVVRDNLKVFFSRYQNRYRDLLSSICPAPDNTNNMSMDEDVDVAKHASAQQSALARCDIIPMFIKIQMDLFAPQLESATFNDSKLLAAFSHKLSLRLTSEGFESTVQKMVASIVLIVYDLHARTSLSSFATESTTKEGTLSLKQAQRPGSINTDPDIDRVLDISLGSGVGYDTLRGEVGKHVQRRRPFTQEGDVELSIDPVTDGNETRAIQYRMLDADDKRLLRERGSKMLASHWLQDQVSSLQKGLENTERRSGQHGHQESQHSRRDSSRTRPLVPISTLPGTVKLPLSGQTRLTDHYQRGAPKFVMPNMPQQGRLASERGSTSRNTSKSRTDKSGTPYWTCVVDFSALVWRLSEIKTLLDHRQCLIIVPLDVIDRLDQAKKGHDKENQKTREAIRFLDERLNIVRWGTSEPLLVGQNIKDTLGRWSEAVQFLIPEEEGEASAKVQDDMDDHTMSAIDETTADGDVVMSEAQSLDNPQNALVQIIAPDIHPHSSNKGSGGDAGVLEDPIVEDGDDNDDEEEIEVRNALNVPRVWRPILDACLFMLRKRDEAHRIPEGRFMLLTEDPDLAYYAEWFNIPSSNIQDWMHNGV
ncbi:hypothetical protein BGZ80_000775 [Entomortierella chlamydospora]|uniref:PIN domain-containing protein n=1 Tax=Entomortierella chlamydospora TaxID=101097 RepID=A0A9P6N293_9FUNG|nr:hypothetical protein BGZ80_000775 [Entomortierella chlamydospora]